MDKTCAIMLADGFETIEALAPCDVLRRAGVKTTLAGCCGSRTVTSAQGVVVACDATVEELDLAEYDLMVTPGGADGVKHLGENDTVMTALAARMDRGSLVGSICAAPSLLATLKRLDHRVATCYPGWEKDFPAGVRPAENGVYVDGNLITGSGPAFALPFGLALAVALVGKDEVEKVAAGMLVPDTAWGYIH